MFLLQNQVKENLYTNNKTCENIKIFVFDSMPSYDLKGMGPKFETLTFGYFYPRLLLAFQQMDYFLRKDSIFFNFIFFSLKQKSYLQIQQQSDH